MRRQQTRNSGKSEKRELHGTASVDDPAQGAWCLLRDRRRSHEGNDGRQLSRIERLIAEKVEILGYSVPEMQRNRRVAVEHEFPRNDDKLIPKLALRPWQNVETRGEFVDHAIQNIGSGSASARCRRPSFSPPPNRLSYSPFLHQRTPALIQGPERLVGGNGRDLLVIVPARLRLRRRLHAEHMHRMHRAAVRADHHFAE